MNRFIISSRDEMDEDDQGARRGFAPQPQDNKQERGALVCYFMLGAGLLGPWNALIAATDYFKMAFGQDAHIGRFFTICYLPLSAVLIGVLVYYGPSVMNPRGRINFAFVGFTLVMIMLPVLDFTVVDSLPRIAIGLILSSTLLLGVLDGLSQGALYGEASVFPAKFTHAVVGGTASSGLLLSLLRMATKAALPNTEDGLRASATVYFGIVSFLSFCCLLVHVILLPRLAIVKFYREKAQHGNLLYGEGGSAGDILLLPLSTASSSTTLQKQGSTLSSHRGFTREEEDEMEPITKNNLFSDVEYTRRHSERVRATLQRIWPLASALFVTYLVTLSIFPGVLTEDIYSEELGDWYPLIMITVFHASDLAGKVVPLRWAGGLRRSQNILLVLAGTRIIFWPLFLVTLAADGAVYMMAVLTAFLGLSNGFITALAMTMGHNHIPPQDVELAENILVLFMVAGLNVGALASFVWLLPWPSWLGLPTPASGST